MSIPSLEAARPDFAPVEYNVVIAVDEKAGVTKGGIILPDSSRENDRLGSMKGRLVAASPLAFNYDTWPQDARKPEVGDVVLFAKFGGVLVDGDDGRQWRVAKDKDVLAIYEESPNV